MLIDSKYNPRGWEHNIDFFEDVYDVIDNFLLKKLRDNAYNLI